MMINQSYQQQHLGPQGYGEDEEELLLLSQNEWQQQQQRHYDYIPTTLNQYNIDRCFYLPCFPHLKSCHINQLPLLLTNVSTAILSANDLNRRYATYYDGPLIPAIMSHQIDSYMYQFLKRYFNDLMGRLKVNLALIDFNLIRFQHIVERFQLLQKIFYRRCIEYTNNHTQKYSQQQTMHLTNNLITLDYHELSIGLEFFLQIDVDLFFMKTCSFRGAQPRSIDEGLFCKSSLPSIRYHFQPCQQIICSLCETVSSFVQFNSNRIHRFLNGYYAILNCPATCQTNNIIYALTCPCGEYDFIGSTSSNIGETIESIREKGNRFIHETLISIIAFDNLQYDENHFLNDQKEHFRLYQHLARCPKIIQLFLQMNPQYHCFIPMTYEQTMQEDMNNRHPSSSMDNTIELSMQYVPIPPMGYTFSITQREQQRLFFTSLNERIPNEKLWTPIDLYHTTIIAVLPENCSTLLRKVLEYLFITHAETKLNMFNLRTTNIQQLYGRPYHRTWCENIL